MSASYDVSKTKYIIIGSICLFIGGLLEGLNEAVIKVSNFTVIELTTIRWGMQMMIAICWWSIKKPTSPFVFEVDHLMVQGDNAHQITNWYGDQVQHMVGNCQICGDIMTAY
eukprot:988784_1